MTDSRRGISGRGNSLAVIALLLTGTLLIILLFTPDPAAAVKSFFLSPFLNRYAFGNMINQAALLLLTGLGISVAFKAGVFNLGGEGQLYAGGVAALWMSLALQHAAQGPGAFWVLILILISSALVGGAAAGLSGLLKYLFDTDELISSFLIGSSLIPLSDALINGPLRNTGSYLMTTLPVPEPLRLIKLLPPSQLNITLFVAAALAAVIWVYLFYTTWGYELRLTGMNANFARYGGIRTGEYILLPMGLSGAFHGLAGALLVLGTYHAAPQGFSAGLGWSGIGVALVAGNHPLWAGASALLFAFMNSGAKTAMIGSGFPLEFSLIIQALVFLFITAKKLRLGIKFSNTKNWLLGMVTGKTAGKGGAHD